MTLFNSLFISDLHLTDRVHDAYRWRVFEQCAELSRQHSVTELFVLGDLTEAKDYHSSRLVNKIVDSFYFLRKTSRINEIYFLKGNHDGLDPEHPYFHFLRRMPWASVFVEPTWVDKGKETLLFLPHTRDPEKDWAGLEMGDASFIFLHGTVGGAVSETGQKMEGISLDWFKGLRCTILAGDIHVPQKIGPVEYVGAPYPIRFGDVYQGRALGYIDGKRVEFPLENLRKHTLRLEGPLVQSGKARWPGLRKGDQVTFVIVLSDSELGEWHERKKWCMDFCAAEGAVLLNVKLERKATAASTKPSLAAVKAAKVRTPEETLSLYCATRKVEAPLAKLGKQLLAEE